MMNESFSPWSQLETMELYPVEVESLKKVIEEWYLHDERELEATFSGKTAAETTTNLHL